MSMTEVTVKNWEEFEERISLLARRRDERIASTGSYISEYLFRGQSDSTWPLITTLERFSKGKLLTLEEYYRRIWVIKSQIEIFTGSAWDSLPTWEEYTNQIGQEGLLPPGKFLAYEYFVYLRHHGFPSPLLDWTASPYIAAYFAFRDVYSLATSASIYVYCEYTMGHKSGSSNAPEIRGLGPYVHGHRRHFQQQSQYTICTVYQNAKHTYARHQDAFKGNREDQDELWKFNIPNSERLKILKRLHEFNINAFSLFGSEESLMESLSFREMLFKER